MGDVSGEGVIELGHHGRAKNNCNTNSWFSASSDLGLLRGPNESFGIDPAVQGLRKRRSRGDRTFPRNISLIRCVFPMKCSLFTRVLTHPRMVLDRTLFNIIDFSFGVYFMFGA
jgi:hypothetical protein